MKQRTFQERSELIREFYRRKTSVTELCTREGLSRSTFYAWKREYDSQGRGKTSRAKRFGDMPGDIKKKIVKQVWNQPYASLDDLLTVAKQTRWGRQLSRHDVYRVLQLFNLSNRDRRVLWSSSFKDNFDRGWQALVREMKTPRNSQYTWAERLALVLRVQQGETVTAVAKEAHISRALLYRWMKHYAKALRLGLAEPGMHLPASAPEKLVDILAPKTPARPKVYARQAKKAQVQEVLKLVRQHPDWGGGSFGFVPTLY